MVNIPEQRETLEEETYKLIPTNNQQVIHSEQKLDEIVSLGFYLAIVNRKKN